MPMMLGTGYGQPAIENGTARRSSAAITGAKSAAQRAPGFSVKTLLPASIARTSARSHRMGLMELNEFGLGTWNL